MRTADAEAIEFNDQYRVVAQSSFDLAVGGIELDGNLLEPPYVIEVIGDPHTLHGGLTFASGPIETLEQYDGRHRGGRGARLDRHRERPRARPTRQRRSRHGPVACPSRPTSNRGDTVYPEDLKYTSEHEWVRIPGEAEGSVRIGITHFAQDALGDIVYVSLPEVGEQVTGGETCGELESTKSVSDVYAPLTGEVVARNEALDATPELVNNDPYAAGWLFEVVPSDAVAGRRPARRRRLPGRPRGLIAPARRPTPAISVAGRGRLVGSSQPSTSGPA